MSTFIAYLLDDGIVFAADRNITFKNSSRTLHIEGRKILKWPGCDALVGYVGKASIKGQMMDEWLADFITWHPNVANPGVVAKALQMEIQTAMLREPLTPSIIQFAAFGERDGVSVPEYWHIANVHGMDDKLTGRYDKPTRAFGCSEEMLNHWASHIAPRDLQAALKRRADTYDPQWFHHSIELGVFNALETGAKVAIAGLQQSGLIKKPTALSDWESHARFWILQYGAYFSAFYPADQQYVGGADVLSIPWP